MHRLELLVIQNDMKFGTTTRDNDWQRIAETFEDIARRIVAMKRLESHRQ
jgi:hypothetical protein